MSYKKILHFGNDDKFIEKAYKEFQKFNHIAKSDYIIFTSKKLRYVDFPCKVQNSHFLSNRENEYLFNSYDLIIIHFLDEKYIPFLKNGKIRTKILWMGWGGDYYWLINTLPNFDILKPLTRNIVKERNNIWLKTLKRIRNVNRYNIINRINFFSPVLEEDYLLIKKNYSSFKPKYIEWNYGNLEEDYVKDEKKHLGNSILIGNSATKTNNHLDILNIIQNLNLYKFDIYLPLSYGEANYKNEILNYVKNIEFKGALNCLEDFMPYNEYISILEKCGNVFMGHIRQQAMGNILALLYMGAKVFFFRESVVYKYLTNKGVKVFSYDELFSNPKLLETNLNDDVIINNRKILLSNWGKTVNERNTQNILLQI